MTKGHFAGRPGTAQVRSVAQAVVVILLIVLAVGIFLPYLTDRGRRGLAGVEASDRMRHLVLGLQQFNEAYTRMPPALGATPSVAAGILVDNPKGVSGAYTTAFPYSYLNVHGFLLPYTGYIDQEKLYDSMIVPKTGERTFRLSDRGPVGSE